MTKLLAIGAFLGTVYYFREPVRWALRKLTERHPEEWDHHQI